MSNAQPGRGHPHPQPSTISGPHIQISLVSRSVTISLLLLMGGLHGELVAVQEPSFATVLKGQSASLDCGYTSDGEDIFRNVFYWALKEGSDPVVIHPDRPTRYRNRLTLIKSEGGRRATLRIYPLQLNDSTTYYCYISFLVGEQSFTKEGPGTRLFVYEPLKMTPPADCVCDPPDRRSVSCQTRVPDGNEVRIVWLRDGEVVRGETGKAEVTSDSTHWLQSQLPLPAPTPGTTTNFTCLLNHSLAGTIDSRWHIAQYESLPHPVLLYVLLLVNSAILLLIVIVFGLRKHCPGNRSGTH
ncbi:uncharacterized protein LOC144486618 [Mustelus asterias]